MKINWGIIGCGDVCEVKSGPAFRMVHNSNLKAVMRRDKEKVKDFAVRHGVEKWYTNAQDLIHDKDVNAIYIATPPNTHAHYSIVAMLAGKPVYVEKPMALNYAECLKMIETSKQTGVKLYVAYYRRFFPYFLKIKEIINNQQIGSIIAINLTTILAPRANDHNQVDIPWHLQTEISGGGYFIDSACHQLDILDFLFGAVEEVQAWYTNRAKIYKVEDTLVANLKFKSGILASCLWSYVGHESNSTERIEIFGTKGKIVFPIAADTPILLATADNSEMLDFEKPKHVELPMIEQVIGSLLKINDLKTNMESAARTSWVIDKVMGRL